MSGIASSSLLELSRGLAAPRLRVAPHRGKPLDLRLEHHGFECPFSIAGVIVQVLAPVAFGGK